MSDHNSMNSLPPLSPPPQNIGRKTKRSRPSNLKELLLLAVKRMMFPGVRHSIASEVQLCMWS